MPKYRRLDPEAFNNQKLAMNGSSGYDGRVPHTCHYCQKEIIEPKTAAQFGGRQYTKYQLQANGTAAIEAANNGCFFFQWLIADFLDEDGRMRDRDLVPDECYFELDFTHHRKDEKSLIHPFALKKVRSSRCTENMSSSNATLSVTVDEGDPAWEYVEPIQREVSVETDENFILARKWINDCHESHTRCAKPLGHFTPTRLLKFVENTLYLYQPSPGEALEWATLSYCWGGFQAIRTTTQTLEKRLASILLSDLPKTIQDAVVTTQKLGLQYLWVDCLCIIQDDPSDMTHEISLIPQIYSNAYVTISAARSLSSSSGFLHPITLPTPQDESFRLPFRTPTNTLGSIILYGQDNLTHRRDPIESRAWTLQEHILSPRLLVFGSRQIWWTCRRVHTNINSSGRFSEYSEIGEIRLRFLNIFVSQRRRWLNNIPGQTWLSLVQHYTNRALTFSEDKLTAISGIADYYAREMKDGYLAGHFKKSLVSSLLWKRVGSPMPKAEKYRAPSWSWAAVDGPVKWEEYRHPISPHLKVLDCDVELESVGAPYGAVKSARLTLRGRLRHVLWNSTRDRLLNPDTLSRNENENEEPSIRAETIPDFLLPHPHPNPSDTPPHHCLEPTPVYLLEIASYTANKSEPRHCLPGQNETIFGIKRRTKRPALPKGLVLSHSPTPLSSPADKQILNPTRTFTRIGLFAFREVEDLPVPESQKNDPFFKEDAEREKRDFFEDAEVQTLVII